MSLDRRTFLISSIAGAGMGGAGMVKSALSAGKTRAGNNAAKKMVTIRRRLGTNKKIRV